MTTLQNRFLLLLVDALGAHQRVVARAAEQAGSELQLVEARLLGVVSRAEQLKQPVSKMQCASSLGLDEAGASRLIRRLHEKGFLKQKSDSSDNRRQILSLSPRGAAVLKENNRLISQATDRVFSVLSASEYKMLLEFFRTLSGDEQYDSSNSNEDLSPLLSTLQQVTEHIGGLGRNLFGLGFSIEELQVLRLIAKKPNVRPSQLAKNLGVSSVRMHRVVESLRQAQKIVVRSNQEDRRARDIRLSKGGIQALHKAEELLYRWLRETLKNMPEVAVTQVVDIIRKYATGDISRQSMPKGLSLQLFRSPAELGLAQAAVAQQLVAQQRISEIPEVMNWSHIGMACVLAKKKIVAATSLEALGDNKPVLLLEQSNRSRAAAEVLLQNDFSSAD